MKLYVPINLYLKDWSQSHRLVVMPRLKSRFIILVIVFSFIIILMFNVWTDESMKSVTDFSIFRFNKKATRLRRVVSTGSNNNVESAYTKKPSYQINDSTPPWFLSNGWLRPELLENRHNLAVWPEEAASERDDRIINQLMYIPPNYVKVNYEKFYDLFFFYFSALVEDFNSGCFCAMMMIKSFYV